MRVKTGKAVSKIFGIWVFFLLLILKGAFPNAAFAFTSLNGCAKSRECLELIKGSARSAVSAPTSAGNASTAIRSTTSSGAIKTFVNAPVDFAIVVGPSAVYVGWHYWSQAQNEQAQNKAKERYCSAPSADISLCPSPDGTFFWRNHQGYYRGPYQLGGTPQPERYSYYSSYETYAEPSAPSPYDKRIRLFNSDGSVGIWDFYMPGSADFIPFSSGTAWKDWPQAKRDAAVALLNDSEWQRLITSMPRGGTLEPGDIIKAPKIPIPGQEWDNPNTPWDDRRLKTVPGEHARPVVPDFDHDSDPDESDTDDDNDGYLDPYDPKPKNPYVPRASSTPPPPPPEGDTPDQSEGEREVSQVRESYGDFLEKPENDVFENRLNAIEDKYRRAAAMEDEAAVDPDVGYEQDRLIAEADSELRQLENEIGEVWLSRLSQYERQLFNNRPQAEIDEIQRLTQQWDKATYNDVAHSILDHSLRKGYQDPLEFLRDVSNFEKSRAERIPREGVSETSGTVRWEIRSTGEYIIETPDGRIITYGAN